MTMESGPGCSLSEAAVFQAMSRLERTRSEAFSDNGTASLGPCRLQRLQDVEGPGQQLAGVPRRRCACLAAWSWPRRCC
jgi:hypothetical protein